MPCPYWHGLLFHDPFRGLPCVLHGPPPPSDNPMNALIEAAKLTTDITEASEPKDRDIQYHHELPLLSSAEIRPVLYRTEEAGQYSSELIPTVYCTIVALEEQQRLETNDIGGCKKIHMISSMTLC